MQMNKRKLAEKKGRHAETIAAWWLRLQGYRLLAQRVRNPRGEIDIIAHRFGITVFVEVKLRSKSSDLEQSINAHKMKRVVAAAHAIAHQYPGNKRFDIILIAPWSWPIHLKNVHHDG